MSSTVLMKLAFLARQETRLRSDNTFYDFVPYKYGPFSFALYRELAGLRRNGYLSPCEDHIAIPAESMTMSQEKIEELSEGTLSEARELTRRYANMSQNKLLKKVYARYPWYATKSQLKTLKPTKTPRLRAAVPAVYTIGYEGKSVDGFFRDLLRTCIREILDVRANPVSRKYGFAKSSLKSIAAKLDIKYQHLPELGIPSTLRKSLNSYSAYQRLLARYEKTLLNEKTNEVARAAHYMKSTPCVLLCMEKDVRCCHRSRLAEAIADGNGLSVRHI